MVNLGFDYGQGVRKTSMAQLIRLRSGRRRGIVGFCS
jgi:hypothetical protein